MLQYSFSRERESWESRGVAHLLQDGLPRLYQGQLAQLFSIKLHGPPVVQGGLRAGLGG